MDRQELEYLHIIEAHASETGWVAPLTCEDKEYLSYLRSICKRYGISLSKATEKEIDFVAQITEREFGFL